MILLVNDAGILIDLLKADLITPFFQLEYEFHVTDFVVAEVQEDNAYQLETIVSAGRLNKKTFDFDELLEIQRLELQHKSFPFLTAPAFTYLRNCPLRFLPEILHSNVLPYNKISLSMDFYGSVMNWLTIA